MKYRQIERYGDWHIATAAGCKGGLVWVAWAKMGQITGTDPINEPGEHVRFKFGETRGETRDAALQKIKTELGLI